MDITRKNSKLKFKLTLIIVLVALFNSFSVFSQKLLKNYVADATVSINSIEPDSIDFSDLKPIGDAIGNSNVVLLGEQDHGDAPTFLAKTRLIKYLHEMKGFNVLAFESDFFGLNYGWQKVTKTHPAVDTFILKNIFSVWTICNTCSNLFYQYIPFTYTTNNPLVLTGFDSQQYLNFSYYKLSNILDSNFRARNLTITRQANYKMEIFPLIDSPKRWIFFPPKDTVKVHQCLESLQTIRNQLKSQDTIDNFWVLVIDNLIQQTNDVLAKFKTGKYTLNGRDIQMAINLKWLIENQYNNQKIIVWAASSHIAKYGKNIDNGELKNTVTMGDHLVKTLAKSKKVYILGFTSLQGNAGRIGMRSYNVRPLKKNSFESWINPVYKYAFTDFGEFNKQFPNSDEYFYMCGFGHVSLLAKWNNIYDGMFYIRDMYRCTSIR